MQQIELENHTSEQRQHIEYQVGRPTKCYKYMIKAIKQIFWAAQTAVMEDHTLPNFWIRNNMLWEAIWKSGKNR